ncbi:MAG TPA: hypothetical protein VIY27_00420 [Myxococcota bacterium]
MERVHCSALLAAFVFTLAGAVRAAPAMFDARFVMDTFGNDVTTGTAFPSSRSFFVQMPIAGPAKGVGFVSVTPTGTGPAPLALPRSAFRITTSTFWPIYPPTTIYVTYASFANAAGNFFAGGGPAAGVGTVHHKGDAKRVGSWFIREGAHGFGGAMGLLGRQGAYARFAITGFAGWFTGTSSWNMIRAMGRSGMDTLNPYTNTGTFVNQGLPPTNSYSYVATMTTYTKFASGTPWTTGSVTLYATAGTYTTILHRAGYDTTTPGGVRNIQLVTPGLTHWKRGHGRPANHTGHIGILKIRLVPEPRSALLLVAGAAVLVLLHRARPAA